MKASDRYLKLVEWSDEDQCYVGSAPGLIGRCCHGKDEAAVYKKLCKIVEEWVELYEKDGRELPEAFAEKEFSGKFVIRVGEDLHKALAIKAIRVGESLNTYCTNQLRNSLQIDAVAGLPKGHLKPKSDAQIRAALNADIKRKWRGGA